MDFLSNSSEDIKPNVSNEVWLQRSDNGACVDWPQNKIGEKARQAAADGYVKKDGGYPIEVKSEPPKLGSATSFDDFDSSIKQELLHEELHIKSEIICNYEDLTINKNAENKSVADASYRSTSKHAEFSAMAEASKSGRTIRSKERELISKVIDFCDMEAEMKVFTVPLSNATLRASRSTGVSQRTICKIRKEKAVQRKAAGENTETRLPSPGKHRKRPEHRNVGVDDFDARVIREIVQNYYVTEKRVPTVKKLLPVVKERINFPWGETSLLRVLKKIGFRWRKCQTKHKIVVERPTIVSGRAKYLSKMKQMRQENLPIIYLDETWVDSGLTYKRCRQHGELFGMTVDTNTSNRLIILHAASKEGFLEGSQLVFKAGTTTGDCHGQMISENFSKWIETQLIPNLPSNSIVVIDNASYHNVQIDRPPTKSTVKPEMIQWLRRKGIPCEETMRKPKLYELIERHKPAEKKYAIDNLLEAHGHTVLRTPPYMRDLNPIELAWAKVRQLVRSVNISADCSLKKLTEVTMDVLKNITKEDWETYCNRVKQFEEEYWKKDGLLEDTIDTIITNLGQDSGSSDDNNYSDSDSDGESE